MRGAYTENAKIFCNFVENLPRTLSREADLCDMANSTLDKIRLRMKPELEAMNRLIDSALATSNPLMDQAVTQYLRTKGKQIRPVLVILSARLFGMVNDTTLHGAAALEMLHNASLIHDDVVDNTDTRRGHHTLNRDFDNRIAVLVGDFFVSNSLAEALRTSDLTVITAISDLGKELSLGEIDQICNARDCSISEERYFNVIQQKTASLFMKCARIGAESAGASPDDQDRIVAYARLLGLCFQIKDDIFDYFEDTEIGKPTGNDLRENKVSLPLIYAINNAPAAERDELEQLICRGSLSDSEIAMLTEFARTHGGIDYAYSVMENLRQEADEILKELPAGEWRDAFSEIFDFTISRRF